MQRARIKSMLQIQVNATLPITKAPALDSSGSSALRKGGGGLVDILVCASKVSDAFEIASFLGGPSLARPPMLKQRNGMLSIRMQKMSVEVAGGISCMNSAAQQFRLLSKALSIIDVEAQTELCSNCIVPSFSTVRILGTRNEIVVDVGGRGVSKTHYFRRDKDYACSKRCGGCVR
jgi:hypothetical protein